MQTTSSTLTCGNPTLNRPEPDAPFNEPWEAEAFAMTVKLHEAGHFTWSEWAEELGGQIKSAPEQPYYESWLAALEALVERKGLMDHGERNTRIAAWDHAARHTPHGQPIVLKA